MKVGHIEKMDLRMNILVDIILSILGTLLSSIN